MLEGTWIPEDQATSSGLLHLLTREINLHALEPLLFLVFCHLQLTQLLTNSETKQEILLGFRLYSLRFFIFTCKYLKWTLF